MMLALAARHREIGILRLLSLMNANDVPAPTGEAQTFDLRRITAPGPTPQLNKKDLSPVLMPLPPTLDEQADIVEALAAADQTIAAHTRGRAVLADTLEKALDHVLESEVPLAEGSTESTARALAGV